MQRLFALMMILFISKASAAIKTQSVDYKSEQDKMQGFVAYDDEVKTQRPAILIVHDWMGLSTFTKEKAEELAKQGYVAFAVDVYGQGVRPKDQKQASELATKFKNDRKLLRAHMQAAFDKVLLMPEVDAKKVAVMGYCFGGTAALELARDGAPLVGTVTFHGGLSTPTPQDAKNIQGRVLALHGADDPYVPPAEVKAFKEEMKKAKVPMEFIAYPGAVHAFAVPAAGNDKTKGAAYNAEADKKSWQAFEKFLSEIF